MFTLEWLYVSISRLIRKYWLMLGIINSYHSSIQSLLSVANDEIIMPQHRFAKSNSCYA